MLDVTYYMREKDLMAIAEVCHTNETSGVTYDEIREILREHFMPMPSEIVESYRFHNRRQEQGKLYQST